MRSGDYAAVLRVELEHPDEDGELILWAPEQYACRQAVTDGGAANYTRSVAARIEAALRASPR